MEIIEAIILGIIQGATEFLPISSSGHLLLLPSLLNIGEPNLNAIAMAHQGTLLAVLIYFRRDLWEIARAMIGGLGSRKLLELPYSRLGWFIVLGSIPAVIAGLLLDEVLENALSHPSTAAVLLLGNAAILWVGEKVLRSLKSVFEIGPADALAIGIAQVAALFPGISRSGVTMSAGMASGLDRSSAARFSFLLGVPVIAGAGLIAAYDLVNAPDIADQVGYLFVTFITAFIVGYACIYFLLRWVRTHTLYIFSAYSAAAGLIYLAIEWLR